jgi:hypothetical protein
MSSETDQEQNRRRFHRILFDAPAMLRHNGHHHSTTLIDVSLKGALARRPEDWAAAPGDSVELEIYLGDGEPHITMQGAVTHTEEGHIGIRCDQIDIDSISHLRRLAELNLGDAELVERELEALG